VSRRGKRSFIVSSFATITRANYDTHLRELRIWFCSETEHHYIYFGVPLLVYEQLLAAPSKGRYVEAYIRNRYRFVRR
jgi:KTSC domain